MGLFSKGGGGKQTTTSEPWKAWQPFAVGGEVTDKTTGAKSQVPGIYPEAARLYAQGEWSPEMQQATDLYKSLFGQRLGGTDYMIQRAADIGGGMYDTSVQAAGPIQAGGTDIERVRAAQTAAERVQAQQMRQEQGVLDPTQAYAHLLSGQVNTQYLDPLAQTIMANIIRGTAEQALPTIRGESLGAGQYGSSRQGVAEGLALSRLNQDLATGIAPMYAQAFENAQNRQSTAANEIDTRAYQLAAENANRQLTSDIGNADRQLTADTGNADRRLTSDIGTANRAFDASKVNAELTLQNNNQRLQANKENLQNALRASDLYGQALNFQDLGFGQYQQLLNMPQAYEQGLLGAYAGLVQPGSGIGGTSTQTAQQGRNPLTAMAGGAMMGAGVGGGAAGAGIGAVLGLLTSLV